MNGECVFDSVVASAYAQERMHSYGFSKTTGSDKQIALLMPLSLLSTENSFQFLSFFGRFFSTAVLV